MTMKLFFFECKETDLTIFKLQEDNQEQEMLQEILRMLNEEIRNKKIEQE